MRRLHAERVETLLLLAWQCERFQLEDGEVLELEAQQSLLGTSQLPVAAGTRR